MNDTTDTPQPAADEASFFEQLSMMRKAFMASPVRNAILALSAGMFGVILATAFGQIILNRWNQPFYDALERRDLSAFFGQLVIFAYIAGELLVLNVGQTWLKPDAQAEAARGADPAT
jgi:putative ATP-binding cassette transporter